MKPSLAQDPPDAVPSQENLPVDPISVVVSNLTEPPPDIFLTQPVATLLTGLLAILAASIAFGGVVYTQWRTAKTTRTQIAAMADLERVKHRRQADHDAFSAMMASTLKMRDATFDVQSSIRPDHLLGVDQDEDEKAAARYPVLVALASDAIEETVQKGATLLLFGHDATYETCMDFVGECRLATVHDMPFDASSFGKSSVAAIEALRKSYRAIEGVDVDEPSDSEAGKVAQLQT